MGCQVVTEPVSRTYQYRKVMKPMLERKRRARINTCLEELKKILIVGLQSEGESVTKLEKADVLELTVKHLQNLHSKNQLQIRPVKNDFEKLREGFAVCAQEVSKCLASIPGMEITLGKTLMTHLGNACKNLEKTAPLHIFVPPPSITSPPLSSASSGYSSAGDLSPAPSTSSTTSSQRSTPPLLPPNNKAPQGLLAIATPLNNIPAPQTSTPAPQIPKSTPAPQNATRHLQVQSVPTHHSRTAQAVPLSYRQQYHQFASVQQYQQPAPVPVQ